MADRRQGCLQGLLELFLLNTLFDWLQKNFGFGRGCLGIPCGLLLLCVFVVLVLSVCTGTNWFSLTGR
ncbi:MAG: hypothetical protein ACM3JD_15155 [Rudaea sp.]